MVTQSSILAGESHGQRSLVGCSPWGHKYSDMTSHYAGMYQAILQVLFSGTTGRVQFRD